MSSSLESQLANLAERDPSRAAEVKAKVEGAPDDKALLAGAEKQAAEARIVAAAAEQQRRQAEQPQIEKLQKFLNPDAKIHGEPIVDESINSKGTDYLEQGFDQLAGKRNVIAKKVPVLREQSADGNPNFVEDNYAQLSGKRNVRVAKLPDTRAQVFEKPIEDSAA